MRTRILILGAVVFGALLLPTQSAQASTKGGEITQERAAGPYSLILQVGPSQRMGKGMADEKMLGGQMPHCMSAAAMSGMKMGDTCNHHVELHVFRLHTKQVVKGAKVSIQLVDTRRHATIVVPIMVMIGKNAPPSDYHYGNDVHAAAGTYNVQVKVNAVKATFTVKLSG